MRARRAAECVLVAVILAAFSGLVAVRTARRHETPRAEVAIPSHAFVEPVEADAESDRAPVAAIIGTVSGKYGPIDAVLVLARAGGEVVARTRTGAGGRYRVAVPAGVEIDVEVRPIPETLLDPARRVVLPLVGEELIVDFELARGGTASGIVTGATRTVCFDVVAIRVEDYPIGPDPPSIGSLEAAPKVAARMTGVDVSERDAGEWPHSRLETGFAFSGLDLGATYRLAVLDRYWALERPVFFRAGDTDIAARAAPVLRLFVEAHDFATGDAIPRFRVTLSNRAGTVLGTYETEDGRVSQCLPRPPDTPRPSGMPRWETLPEDAWELLVHADGYVDETAPADGIQRIALRRAGEPNVLLRLRYDDDQPCDTAIEVRFESIEDPDGLLEVAAQRHEPGVFRLSLPPGKWRLHVKRPSAFQGATRIADVEVGAKGPVETSIRYVRGGVVTFEGNGEAEREGDENGHLVIRTGRYEDVPAGVYLVRDAEGKELWRFEVLSGSSQAVRMPKPDEITSRPDPGEDDG